MVLDLSLQKRNRRYIRYKSNKSAMQYDIANIFNSKNYIYIYINSKTLTKSSLKPSLLVLSFCSRPSSRCLAALDMLGLSCSGLFRMLSYISAVLRL